MRVGLLLAGQHKDGASNKGVVGCMKFDFELSFPNSTGGRSRGKGKSGKRFDDDTFRWSTFNGQTAAGRRLKYSLVEQLAEVSKKVALSFTSNEIQKHFNATSDSLALEGDSSKKIMAALQSPLFASNALGKNATQPGMYLVYPQHYLDKSFPPELLAEPEAVGGKARRPSDAYRFVRLMMRERFFERVVPDHPETKAIFAKLLNEALRDKTWKTSVEGMVQVFENLCAGSAAKGDKSGLTTHFTDGVGIKHLVKRAEGISNRSSLLIDDVFEGDDNGGIDIGDLSCLTHLWLLMCTGIQHAQDRLHWK
mmetsp:Transcript_25019/g.67512  ORF Transcript_25019/g.67512 Transcript_25019/m.67512 type:complete len:309 (+) Transcript_25019:248-1174(+)